MKKMAPKFSSLIDHKNDKIKTHTDHMLIYKKSYIITAAAYLAAVWMAPSTKIVSCAWRNDILSIVENWFHKQKIQAFLNPLAATKKFKAGKELLSTDHMIRTKASRATILSCLRHFLA
jgi:hypothetical protein